MNAEQETAAAVREAEDAIRQLGETANRIAAAREKTEEVLQIASKYGVKTVGIGVRHASLGNESFSFGPRGSIFTPVNARVDGWPAAWRIAEEAGISYGAGNTGQHQIDNSQVLDGLYRCVKGVWQKVASVD